MFKLVALYLAAFVWSTDSLRLANFSQGPPVQGVAVIQDNIYLIKDSQQAISVYRTDLLTLKLNASLPIVTGPYDMVASAKLDSLYLLDSNQANDVIRINLAKKFDSSTWKFTNIMTSAALSMTSDNKLIVTKSALSMFDVYNLDGKLSQSVQLKNITSPRQVIKLSAQRYAVCFGYASNETHGVCIVDGQGKTVKCFQGLPGNSLTQLNVPVRMLLLKSGAILVADMKNGRIVQLSKDLTKMRVAVSTSDGLTQPYRMHLDEKKKRLYVADTVTTDTGRILIFDY